MLLWTTVPRPLAVRPTSSRATPVDGWDETARLVAPDATIAARFGDAVSISAGTIVIGAVRGDASSPNSGAAYTFAHDPQSGWVYEQKLSAAGFSTGDEFGTAVDIDGDLLAVGAPAANTLGLETGAVRVFRRTGGSWSHMTTLTKAYSSNSVYFGKSLALDGTRLVVGAPGEWSRKGLVQVYEFDGLNWVPSVELTDPDGGFGDDFGNSVDARGERILVGVPGKEEAGVEAGAAFLYQRSGPDWLATLLVPSDGDEPDRFGWAVAIGDSAYLVGSPYDDVVASDVGSAYVFEVDPPSPFQPFGLGDGSFGACPCGNESAPGAGQGCLNSTGAGARIDWEGSASMAADDLLLIGEGLLPGQPALLFMGANKRATGQPFGDGLLGMWGTLTRLPIEFAAIDGTATWSDLHALGHWSPGTTRMFQLWYRDPAGLPCGSFFNLSGGLQVSFAP